MVVAHGDQSLKDSILSQLDNIDKKIPTLGENAINSIQRIEEMMGKSEIINITDEIKLRAT
ncbi:MAG: hypothetical protein IPH31_10725 [Lewinellaceae bacterium]|nr:hypothetical protein [Lewinellaceae bacterium]